MIQKGKFKWLWAVAGTIVAVLLLRVFALTWCLIPSAGMENTLFRGERIAVNKWSYGLRMPGMAWWGYHRFHTRPVGRGDIVLFNNPGDVNTPVADRRELFISRCIGLPGDTLWTDLLFALLPGQSLNVPDKKMLYSYRKDLAPSIDSLLLQAGVTDSEVMGDNEQLVIRGISRYGYYLLTQECDSIEHWLQPMEKQSDTTAFPLIIPGKGIRIEVTGHNRMLLLNTLLAHEHRQAEIVNDTLYVDGKPSQWCEFTKDYYWMVSDNSINWCDSRLFGLLPHDHVVGKATRIWFSKDQESGPFTGYHWNRFFQPIQ